MGLMGAIAREVISGGGAVLGSALIPFHEGCYDDDDDDNDDDVDDGDDDDDYDDGALLGLQELMMGIGFGISIFVSLPLTTSSSLINRSSSSHLNHYFNLFSSRNTTHLCRTNPILWVVCGIQHHS